MKKLHLLVVLLALAAIFTYSACCDDEPVTGYCSEAGVITGIDFRECACCGGWFIEIGEDTLRAWTLPQEFAESLQMDEFPLPVYLEWEYPDPPCLGDEIEVACIRRR